MKIYYIFIIIFSFYSCKSNTQEIEQSKTDEILFAKIKGDSYVYVLDTLSFKESISGNFFSKESKKDTYDKVNIIKSQTLGNTNEDYYYVVLIHFGKKLKTARYLENRSGYLYLNKKTVFNTIYNSCVGVDEKCFPNVVINSDLTRAWICSDKVGVCSLDANECKSIRSIIQE